MFNKKNNCILKVDFSEGAIHDFKLLKDSNLRISKDTKILVDKGYIGIDKLFSNNEIAKKRSKNKYLTEDEIASNKLKSKRRIYIEHLFGHLKKFAILRNKFRFKIKSFISKFLIISGFYNFENSF